MKICSFIPLAVGSRRRSLTRVSWQEAGLREGDYIVAVDGQDCKWAKHAEVVHLLKNCSDGGVELSVVTLHSHDTQVSVGGVEDCGLMCAGLTAVSAGGAEGRHAVPQQG